MSLTPSAIAEKYGLTYAGTEGAHAGGESLPDVQRSRASIPDERLPWNAPDLIQDLQLDTVFGAMAAGDTFLHDVAKSVALSGLDSQLDIVSVPPGCAQGLPEEAPLVRTMYALASMPSRAGRSPIGVLRSRLIHLQYCPARWRRCRYSSAR